MEWLIIIVSLILVIPTYGISLIFLIWYMISTGKKRRYEIITELIREAYINHEGQMINSDAVYYEASVKFALENGGTINETTGNVSVDLVVNGDKVNAYFCKDNHTGGIIFSVSNKELQRQKFLKKFGLKDSELIKI